MRPPAILLVLPILGLNLALAGALPAAFQPAIFDTGLPPWLPPLENGLRLAMFGSMLFLPIQAGRVGWTLFGICMLTYAASWAALILVPASPWSLSLIGFTAPAWTPAIWLAGIGRIARSAARLPRRGYALLASAFLVAHIGHAALVWMRL